MRGLASLAERRAAARADALRQWLASESASARRAASARHLLYVSVAEFVLRRGRAFETGRLSDAERRGAARIARWCRDEHNGFKFGQPFWNTRRAFEFDVLDQFQYVEGFVLDEGETVPRAHAWLSTIANDAVVDFTGPSGRKRRAGNFPTIVLGEFVERSYFGVVLPRDIVLSTGSQSFLEPTKPFAQTLDGSNLQPACPCSTDGKV